MYSIQTKNLTNILQNDDLKNYVGDAFWNLIQEVLKDVPGVSIAKSAKELIFNMPSIIFWNKMRRFLGGVYKSIEDQIKMAKYFDDDNDKYCDFVKKLICMLDQFDDEEKIDYFARLTRCLLLEGIELPLYFKLANYLKQMTLYELEYLKAIKKEIKLKNDPLVSSLVIIGLFEQQSTDDEVYYVVTGYGVALKGNCLNYDDELRENVYKSYKDIEPISISEPALVGDIKQISIKTLDDPD